MVFGEVLGLVDFFDAGHDAAERAGADDGEAVLLVFVQLVEFLGAADAGLGVPLQLGNHPVLFHGDVLLHFRAGDAEVEFLLQVHDHAAEVLADEVVEEFGAGVAVWVVVFGEDLVGEVGAGFEGEFFGEDEGVVAVEEDFGDLGWQDWLAEDFDSTREVRVRCCTLGMMRGDWWYEASLRQLFVGAVVWSAMVGYCNGVSSH